MYHRRNSSIFGTTAAVCPDMRWPACDGRGATQRGQWPLPKALRAATMLRMGA